MIASAVESLDDERLGGSVKQAIAERLHRLEVAPLMGQAIAAAMKEERHIPVLDGILNRASLMLASNEELIRDLVHERSNRLLRWTGLDENVADAIINALNKLMTDMADNPGHPLRLRVDEMLAELAYRLQTEPEIQARMMDWKANIIENPAMQAWISGLWDQGREALLKAARDPDKAMAGRMGQALRDMGGTLESDLRLNAMVNRFVRRAIAGIVANYGDGIVRLVSDTVRGWDASTITGRIEDAVGKDLQYIRINGTLVGGLVGLALHAVDTAF